MSISTLGLERSAVTPSNSRELFSPRLVGASLAVSLGLGAVAAADRLPARLRNRPSAREADFLSFQGLGDDDRYIIPGCRGSGAAIADLLQPSLESSGRTTYVEYPIVDFSINSVGEGLLRARRARQETGAGETTIGVFSMGAIALCRLLSDRDYRNAFGSIDRIVLDSSPASYDHIKDGSKKHINLARKIGNSEAGYQVARRVISRNKKDITQHDDRVTDAQVKNLFAATSRVHVSAILGQARFMNQTELKPGSLADFGGEVVYLRAEQDDVVDVDEAHKHYQAIFDREITQIIDRNRPAVSHAVGMRYQEQLLELIT